MARTTLSPSASLLGTLIVLPFEVRQNIFRLVLSPVRNFFRSPGAALSLPQEAPLLRTSRAIRHEAIVVISNYNPVTVTTKEMLARFIDLATSEEPLEENKNETTYPSFFRNLELDFSPWLTSFLEEVDTTQVLYLNERARVIEQGECSVLRRRFDEWAKLLAYLPVHPHSMLVFKINISPQGPNNENVSIWVEIKRFLKRFSLRYWILSKRKMKCLLDVGSEEGSCFRSVSDPWCIGPGAIVELI